MSKEFVVGIDLGTTNSCISWVKPDGSPEVIPNQEGARTTPSVVSFINDEIIVGEPAKRQAIMKPDLVIKSIKRKMGSGETVKISNKKYTPQEISSFILRKLVKDAESYLGGKIKKAVITVPAYFNDAQRQATKEAGEIAGLEVLRIINEPTQAQLAYGLDKQKEEKVAVYDLGGGTFDVSILEIGDGVIQVISTNGNNQLGGDDFDNALVDYLVDGFRKANGKDLSRDKQAMQRLIEAQEKTKIELSTKMQTDINLPFISNDVTGQLHFEMLITRSILENLVKSLVEKTKQPVITAIGDAKLNKADIKEVLLVGGMTRMPLVQKTITDLFGKDGNKNVNPDEAVAVGAQIQQAIVQGVGNVNSDIVLVDVTPLTLGVEVQGGLLEPIIEKNTTIPIKKSKVFTTAVDNQPEVQIRIFQGERPMANDNYLLGNFSLTGILPAPRHVPQIEVTFDIDTNGIVNVTAKDLGTQKEQTITVTGRNNLSKDEIDKMIQDAKQHEEDDKKKQEEIQTKNNATNEVYQAETMLKETGDKIDPEKRQNVESIIGDLKKAIEEDNIIRIKSVQEELREKMMEIGKDVYSKVQPQQDQDQVYEQLKEQVQGTNNTVNEPQNG